MRRLLPILLLPLSLSAKLSSPVLPPQSPRVLAIGGAYVSVADDPQAGFLNPAGLTRIQGIGSDQSFGGATGGHDQFILAYLNPGTESGTSFAMGLWTQGVTRSSGDKVYVPYVGTSWSRSSQFGLGMVVRAPARYPREDSLSNSWSVVSDLSVLHAGRNLNFGGMLERALGGSAGIIPRRLRLGASWIADSDDFLVSYEWQGSQGVHKYTFRYESSHLGLEAIARDAIAFRVGYVWSGLHRITFGTAIGHLKNGWRLEGGWSIRAAGGGSTLWSAGLAYRIGWKE